MVHVMKPQVLRALAGASLIALATGAAWDAGVSPECAKIQARIEKRKRFLKIRAQERLLYPTMPTFSPYCEAHKSDEDCHLLVNQKQRDLSRDVSELEMGPDGKTPVTDPVLVPLLRQRRELRCLKAP